MKVNVDVDVRVCVLTSAGFASGDDHSTLTSCTKVDAAVLVKIEILTRDDAVDIVVGIHELV